MIKLVNASPLLKAKKLIKPKKVTRDDLWTLKALHEHLQWAVDVELYTIPFYMAAMYSIKDQSTEAGRLIKSIVNQEMLHMQSAANIANAYGTELQICAPMYGGEIPHLDFDLDTPNPKDIYYPYSTAIGAFDIQRLNTMCIIEYPDWSVPDSKQVSDEYGSIGELYSAIANGCHQLRECIQGNHKQVNHFERFYPDTQLTITESHEQGLPQVNNLIDLIVDQGEGVAKDAQYVPPEYQNRVDDVQPTWDHYEKFTYMLKQPLPETFAIEPYGERQKKLQEIQLSHFNEFLLIMNETFTTGNTPKDFATVMYKNGAAISACWQNGVLPVFSMSNES
ncbi:MULTISPECIES: ferritin-like protein [Pseudoalteromonas]|uniref:Ferritin-like protein n=1 Tax=Pseudoalteromonas obscura TaxID=3048491 RepID=A0ABT7ENE8_9GAMM|nr:MULTISPECIES: ferritin-like protein [Pseudoalteromonas]MBQ4835178.1 ferritin-like protein [Pseudoalteromonas luteoviolacea]MDK2596574.1 ferritin-like protein [Pseudoalteromonas sp. P94(2023)]